MRLRLIAEAGYDVAEMERQLTLPYRAYNGVPPKGSQPNQIAKGVLQAAVVHHERNMGGKRWPALEQAFLARANTFRGTGGDFVRPRTSLFRYLANLTEPWPEGEELAAGAMQAATSTVTANSRLLRRSPLVKSYRALKDLESAVAAGFDYRPSESIPDDYYA